MALPLALLALVVMGGLVAGAFAAAYVEHRVGRNTLYAAQAAGAAEVGTGAVVGGWDVDDMNLLVPGERVVLASEQLPGPGAYSATVTRLNGELFLVNVEGVRSAADGTPLARRELALVLRMPDSAVVGLPPVVPLAQRSWVPLSF